MQHWFHSQLSSDDKFHDRTMCESPAVGYIAVVC